MEGSEELIVVVPYAVTSVTGQSSSAGPEDSRTAFPQSLFAGLLSLTAIIPFGHVVRVRYAALINLIHLLDVDVVQKSKETVSTNTALFEGVSTVV